MLRQTIKSSSLMKNNNWKNNNINGRNLMIESLLMSKTAISLATTTMIGTGMYFRYKIAGPDQYLVLTGLGIPDIKITKQSFIFPFQKWKYINMHPENYEFNLDLMSSEKIPCHLPVNFTIGPSNDFSKLVNYVRFVENIDKGVNKLHLNEIIKGMLEGEVRILASSMTIEEIFNGRKVFKEEIIKNIQDELDTIGLKIINANIKELTDHNDSKYFFNMRQKKLSEAENNALVDVSEQKKRGVVGSKQRDMEQRIQLSAYESEAVQKENERNQEIEKSKSELQIMVAKLHQTTEYANIESEMNINMKRIAMEKEMEQWRFSLETEKMRAGDLSKTQVQMEIQTKEIETEANNMKIQVDLQFYKTQREAEAQFYKTQKEAEGLLLMKQKEAEGIRAINESETIRIANLLSSFGEDRSSLIQYFMLQEKIYPQLAEHNANALKGLKPEIKITNVNTDAFKDNDLSYAKTFAAIGGMVPSFLDLLKDVNFGTGIEKKKTF